MCYLGFGDVQVPLVFSFCKRCGFFYKYFFFWSWQIQGVELVITLCIIALAFIPLRIKIRKFGSWSRDVTSSSPMTTQRQLLLLQHGFVCAKSSPARNGVDLDGARSVGVKRETSAFALNSRALSRASYQKEERKITKHSNRESNSLPTYKKNHPARRCGSVLKL
jgi:hypothetical protein